MTQIFCHKTLAGMYSIQCRVYSICCVMKVDRRYFVGEAFQSRTTPWKSSPASCTQFVNSAFQLRTVAILEVIVEKCKSHFTELSCMRRSKNDVTLWDLWWLVPVEACVERVSSLITFHVNCSKTIVITWLSWDAISGVSIFVSLDVCSDVCIKLRERIEVLCLVWIPSSYTTGWVSFYAVTIVYSEVS